MFLSTSAAYREVLVASGIVGSSLGLVWAWTAPRMERRISSPVIVAIALTFGALSFWCGLRQFGGFDDSAVTDIAWRVLNGQTPYADFPCTVPPAFVLGAAFAFRLFGPFWASLVAVNAIFTAIAFLWSFTLTRELLDDDLHSIVVSSAAVLMSVVLVSYWWYNPITSMMAVLFLLSSAVFLLRPESWLARLSFGASLCLLAMMKPNVAGLLIVLTTAVLFSSARHRWLAVALCASAAAVFFAVLILNHVSPLLMLQTYRGIANRGFSSRLFQDATSQEREFVKLSLLLFAVPFTTTAGLRMLRHGSRIHFLMVAALVTGIYALLTNGENKLVDGALIVVAGWLYVPPKPNTWVRYCGFAAIFFSCVGIGEAVVRQRVKAVGLNTFFEYRTLPSAVPEGFFSDMTIGPRLAVVDDQVRQVLAAVARHEGKPVRDLNIYFGPRMQWAYAANGLQSPTGIPVWWHPGVSFSTGDEQMYLDRMTKRRFDAIILLKHDATYFSRDLRTMIARQYAMNDALSQLTIFLPR